MPITDLNELDHKHIWHPYTQHKIAEAPLLISRAEGVYLYTSDGRKLLDGISSWWVNIHGHCHPVLNRALAKQAKQLEHIQFANCTHEPAIRLATELLKILPTGLSRIFYSDNGSTAVEVALKMAYQYWHNRGEPRRVFVALHHAYHGDTIGAMSASDDSPFTSAFKPLLFRVERASSPYCYRCPVNLNAASCAIDCLDSLEAKLKEGGSNVAAIIIEPMLQGAGGMIKWPAEFLRGVKRLSEKYNTLLIADEVFTGFGRTGKMFACEHADVRPDIMCLSKGLSAGYLPIAATAATETVYEAFLSDQHSKALFHGHSYTANPLACAVALASLELFQSNQILERIQRLESLYVDALASLRDHPNVGDVRIIGGVAAIELVKDKNNKSADGYLDSVGQKLCAKLMERGLFLRPLGNVLYFLPPYAITDEQANWALDIMRNTLSDWRWNTDAM